MPMPTAPRSRDLAGSTRPAPDGQDGRPESAPPTALQRIRAELRAHPFHGVDHNGNPVQPPQPPPPSPQDELAAARAEHQAAVAELARHRTEGNPS